MQFIFLTLFSKLFHGLGFLVVSQTPPQLRKLSIVCFDSNCFWRQFANSILRRWTRCPILDSKALLHVFPDFMGVVDMSHGSCNVLIYRQLHPRDYKSIVGNPILIVFWFFNRLRDGFIRKTKILSRFQSQSQVGGPPVVVRSSQRRLGDDSSWIITRS